MFSFLVFCFLTTVLLSQSPNGDPGSCVPSNDATYQGLLDVVNTVSVYNAVESALSYYKLYNSYL